MIIHLLKSSIDWTQIQSANPYVNTEVQTLEILLDHASTNEDLSKHRLKGLTQNQSNNCMPPLTHEIYYTIFCWCGKSTFRGIL